MEEQEYVEWLEQRNVKLMEMERMIESMQSKINEEEIINKKLDIRMEIFKLWYFQRYDRKYEGE